LFWFLSEGNKQTPVRIAFLVFALVLIIRSPLTRRAGIQALIAFPLANGMTDALKHGFQWTRPCVDLVDIHVRVNVLTSFGTASAHSANMMAVAFVMTYYFKWWGVPWIVLAIFTGISRIYVGVHYPSQIVFGWICGIVAALVVVKTWEAFKRLRSQPATSASSE
jgi:undecaprenyl-diphosphatase